MAAELGIGARLLYQWRRVRNRYWRPWYLGLSADLELTAGDPQVALRICDDALRLGKETDEAWSDAALLRLRGDILLRLDPKNHAAVEAAYDEAVRTARGQGARTFELEAALKLAKVCRSTGRPAEGHAVLAPALEGFKATPAMPVIAEAQALLLALSETEEVMADVAQRQRLGQLRVAYGNALIGARGHGAPETIEAFAKARESAYAEKDAPERFAADYGLYAGAYTHGELPQARAYAETLLRNVADRPDSPEACVAQRAVGLTRWFAGEYREAQDHLERALALFQPGRDDDLAFRFGWDAGVGATNYLAIVLWPMGDVERAVFLVRGAQTRIAGLSHIGTHALANMHAALFELIRSNLSHAAPNAVELARIAREHDLPA